MKKSKLEKRLAALKRHRPRSPCEALAHFVILCALAATATSCSTPPAVTKVQTVEVKVPVAVQPIRSDQVPVLPAPLPKRPDSPSAALDVALAKICEFVGYAVQADPLLRISAGEKPAPPPAYPECEGKH